MEQESVASETNAESEVQTTSNETHNDNSMSSPEQTQSETTEQTEQTEPEHPDWFMKDKYKSIEEQAKSAFELQKKMGKYWGSPKDNYSVEGLMGISENDPLIKNLEPALKEMGLSQEGFKHLVSQYIEANKNMMKEFEEELKHTLTTKDAHTYREIEKWMTNHLTPEEAQLVKNNWLMSAEDFKVFNQLRLMAAPSTNVPSSTQGHSAKFESSKEVENEKIKYRKELKQGLRVQDKNYENELAARYRDAVARELRTKGIKT